MRYRRRHRSLASWREGTGRATAGESGRGRATACGSGQGRAVAGRLERGTLGESGRAVAVVPAGAAPHAASMWPRPRCRQIRAGGRHRCRGHRSSGGTSADPRRVVVPESCWKGAPRDRGVVGHLFHRPPCRAQPSLAATTARCCAPLPTAGLDREERI